MPRKGAERQQRSPQYIEGGGPKQRRKGPKEPGAAAAPFKIRFAELDFGLKKWIFEGRKLAKIGASPSEWVFFFEAPQGGKKSPGKV